MIQSSASRLACTNRMEALERNSKTKSRSQVASRLLVEILENPNSFATASRSIAKFDPATAHEPSGRTSTRVSDCSKRSASRTNISLYARQYLLQRIG